MYSWHEQCKYPVLSEIKALFMCPQLQGFTPVAASSKWGSSRPPEAVWGMNHQVDESANKAGEVWRLPAVSDTWICILYIGTYMHNLFLLKLGIEGSCRIQVLTVYNLRVQHEQRSNRCPQRPSFLPLAHNIYLSRTRLKRWPRWLQNLALRRPCSLILIGKWLWSL